MARASTAQRRRRDLERQKLPPREVVEAAIRNALAGVARTRADIERGALDLLRDSHLQVPLAHVREVFGEAVRRRELLRGGGRWSWSTETPETLRLVRGFLRHVNAVAKNFLRLRTTIRAGKPFTLTKGQIDHLSVLMRDLVVPEGRHSIERTWSCVRDRYGDAISPARFQELDRLLGAARRHHRKAYELVAAAEFEGDPRVAPPLPGDPVALTRGYAEHQIHMLVVALDIADELRVLRRRGALPQDPGLGPRCPFCRGRSGPMTEGHVFPERAVGDDGNLIVPECDSCRRALDFVDRAIIEHLGVSHGIVKHVPWNPNNGKLTEIVCRNVTIRVTGPRRSVYIHRDKHEEPRFGTGKTPFDLGSITRRYPKDYVRRVARSLYKTALGMMAAKQGITFVCAPRFDRVRDFIHGRSDFRNRLWMNVWEDDGFVEMRGEEPLLVFTATYYSARFVFSLLEQPLLHLPASMREQGWQQFDLFDAAQLDLRPLEENEPPPPLTPAMELAVQADGLLREGRQREALDTYKAALATARQHGDPAAEGAILTFYGRVAEEAKDLSGARQVYQRALELRRLAGDLRGEAVVLHSLARVALGDARFDDAEEHLLGAFGIARRTSSDEAEHAVMRLLEQLYTETGRLEEAERARARADELEQGGEDSAVA